MFFILEMIQGRAEASCPAQITPFTITRYKLPDLLSPLKMTRVYNRQQYPLGTSTVQCTVQCKYMYGLCYSCGNLWFDSIELTNWFESIHVTRLKLAEFQLWMDKWKVAVLTRQPLSLVSYFNGIFTENLNTYWFQNYIAVKGAYIFLVCPDETVRHPGDTVSQNV